LLLVRLASSVTRELSGNDFGEATQGGIEESISVG
jgi:hypothetical protein